MDNKRSNYKTREEARGLLENKIVSQRRGLEQRDFFSHDPHWLIEDAEFRLRWLDCAPEGSLFICAPMQDKRGVPMGDVWYEGPQGMYAKAVREARVRRGLHPLTGKREVG